MDFIDTREVARLAVDLAAEAVAALPAAREIIDEGAQKVVYYAQGYVPVKTGATRDSIGYDMRSELEAEIGPETPYAPYIEYGTVKMGPRPFMAPALDRVEGEVVAAFDVYVGSVLSATRQTRNYIPVGDVLAGSLYQ